MGWIKKLSFLFGVLLGIALFFLIRIMYVQIKTSVASFTPQAAHMILQPPHGTLTARIKNIQGIVEKEGRQDMDFKKITQDTTFVEGEALATKSNGLGIVIFPNITTATLSYNTELDYLNGLPHALVVRQPDGIITYSTAGSIHPFSVRSLALLIQWSDKAKLTITTSNTGQTVLVRVASGEITLAYSDANNTTKVVRLTRGQAAVFDNTASTLTLE